MRCREGGREGMIAGYGDEIPRDSVDLACTSQGKRVSQLIKCFLIPLY